MKTEYKFIIVLICAVAVVIVFNLFSRGALGQETTYDRIFHNHPPNGTEYRTYINGTLVQTSNFKQVIIYNWSNLSENAKRIVRESMELQHYNVTSLQEHYD